MPEGDAAVGEVVRGHFDIDLVAGEDADAVFAHFAGGVRQNFVAVVELYAKHRVGEDFGDDAFEFEEVFFCHYPVFGLRFTCGKR